MTSTLGVVVFSVMAGAWLAPGSIQKAPPTKSKSDVSLAGCLGRAQTEDTFILYNAKRDLKDLNEAAADYLVLPLADLALEEHLKDIVRLTGRIVPAKPVKSGQAEGDTEAAAIEENLPRLSAKSLKTESGTCVTDDDGEGDAHSSDGGWTSGRGGQIGFMEFPLGDLQTFSRFNGSALNAQGLTSAGLYGDIGGFESIASVGSVSGGTLSPLSVASSSSSSGGSSSGGSGTFQVPSLGSLTPSGDSSPLTSLSANTVGGFVAAGGGSNPFTSPVTLNVSSLSSAPIANPEPATMILFGLGLLALAFIGRKRTRNA